MRVVFKKTIIERLDELINGALKTGKRIDYIELTKEEDDLLQEYYYWRKPKKPLFPTYPSYTWILPYPPVTSTYLGYNIKVVAS